MTKPDGVTRALENYADDVVSYYERGGRKDFKVIRDQAAHAIREAIAGELEGMKISAQKRKLQGGIMTPKASQVEEAVKVLEEVKAEMQTLIQKEDGCKWFTYNTDKQKKLYNICDVFINLARLYLEAVKEVPEKEEHHPDCKGQSYDGKKCPCGANEFNSARSQFISLLMEKEREIEGLKKKTIFAGAVEEFRGFTISEQKLLDEINQLQSQLASAKEEIKILHERKDNHKHDYANIECLRGELASAQDKVKELEEQLHGMFLHGENKTKQLEALSSRCRDVEGISKTIMEFIDKHDGHTIVRDDRSVTDIATAISAWMLKGEERTK